MTLISEAAHHHQHQLLSTCSHALHKHYCSETDWELRNEFDAVAALVLLIVEDDEALCIRCIQCCVMIIGEDRVEDHYGVSRCKNPSFAHRCGKLLIREGRKVTALITTTDCQSG